MCTDRIACSRRRFDRRRCRGATCSQGLTGLRGPVAMGSRDTKHGSGFEFFLSQYRSSPSTSYSSAPCNYTRCYAIPTFKLLYFRLCILAIIGTFFFRDRLSNFLLRCCSLWTIRFAFLPARITLDQFYEHCSRGSI